MKKLFVLFLIAALILGTASAETLTTMHDIQYKLMTSLPIMIFDQDITCILTGCIISKIPKEGWYLYMVTVYEEEADGAYPYGIDMPCFWFLSEKEHNPADVVTVTGKLLVYYSSPLIPFLYPADAVYISTIDVE